MKLNPLIVLGSLLTLGGSLSAQDLKIDFSQPGGPVEDGWQAYVASHETPADFIIQDFDAFGATISLTPSWGDDPGGAAAAKQMIQRTEATPSPNLYRDWIGTDTRGGLAPANPLTLTVSGLPAGTYVLRTHHHDPQNQTGLIDITIDDAAGPTTATGFDQSAGGGAGATPAIFEGVLTSDGGDVTLVFDVQNAGVGPGTTDFLVMNGLEIGVALDPDSDGDGLIDLWEDLHFGDNSGTVEPTDLTPQNGTGDPDMDGASNEQEESVGSDPNDSDSDGDGLTDGAELTTWFTDPTDTDSDSDGIEDGEEVVAGTDGFFTDPNDRDTDGDGVTDGAEVANDTDPTDETDFPRVAELAVDFNSNQDNGGDSSGADPQDSVAAHNELGYRSYHANHEAAEEFSLASYSAFGTTITLQPEWPDTIAATVQQSIDRGAGFDDNWGGEKGDLLTDWIGVDTRTSQGGNGAYDGITGLPTRMTMAIGGLPAGSYSWLSFHHDTEHMHPDFIMEVSTDGGTTFVQIGGIRQCTDSTPGGVPDSGMTFDGLTEPASGDPADLPSTVKTCFISDGASDVLFRYTPLFLETPLPTDAPVHRAFFVMNGFEIDEFPNDSDDDCFDDDVETALFGDLSQGPNDDFDNDGLDNITESILETDPTVADTDMDGLDDGDEVNVHGSSPLLTDSDGDSLADGDEVNTFGTSPADPDTDADLFTDDFEIANAAAGFNPLVDNSLDDFDLDDLVNADEVFSGTDPLVADTDMDGLTDGDEVNNLFTDPLLVDSDEDGLEDGEEVNTYMTDPSLDDTDFDFMPDGWEVENELDPTDAGDELLDPDMDNLTNADEFFNGSDPNKADTDGDGLDDGEEFFDWFTDPSNPDTDGDGLEDGEEVNDTMTLPDLADSDGDGYNDGREVTAGLDPLDFLSFPEPPAGALFVDFNSNQDGGGDSTTDPDPAASLATHLQAGYQSYHANHEVAAEFVTASYPAFGTTVTFTPTWPDTADNRVQQSIDRGAGNDGNWNGDLLNLLTDWIGVDTRTVSGGNGDYDGATGTATPMVFTLGGIPAGEYTWRSYHHDTEHMNSRMQIEISTDGGVTFGTPIETTITDSTPGGAPASEQTYDGPVAPGTLDAAALPSTVTTSFLADGINDVVIRFIAFAGTNVHRQFVVVNGFEITKGVVLTDVGFNGGAFEITASGFDPDTRYQLKRSPDGEAFENVGDAFQPDSSTFTAQDPAPTGGRTLYQFFEAAP